MILFWACLSDEMATRIPGIIANLYRYLKRFEGVKAIIMGVLRGLRCSKNF